MIGDAASPSLCSDAGPRWLSFNWKSAVLEVSRWLLPSAFDLWRRALLHGFLGNTQREPTRAIPNASGALCAASKTMTNSRGQLMFGKRGTWKYKIDMFGRSPLALTPTPPMRQTSKANGSEQLRHRAKIKRPAEGCEHGLYQAYIS